jgi:hypothetical protein
MKPGTFSGRENGLKEIRSPQVVISRREEFVISPLSCPMHDESPYPEGCKSVLGRITCDASVRYQQIKQALRLAL